MMHPHQFLPTTKRKLKINDESLEACRKKQDQFFPTQTTYIKLGDVMVIFSITAKPSQVGRYIVHTVISVTEYCIS